MSKPIFTKFATSVAAISFAAACATSPAQSNGTAAADQAGKPSAEEIAIAERADPLTRANFWNTQYNKFPTDPDIAASFSESLRQIGSDKRAAEVANLAAVSHPHNYDVLLEVARAEQGQGNLVAAVRAYGAAAELKPNEATPYAAVGAIYDQNNDHDAAQNAYREALLRDPARPATLSNFGLSYALQGNLDKAEEKLKQASSLPTATAQVRQNYALVLGLLGKFDEAREIAKIDAPDYIAEKNIEFLAQMIGKNVQLEKIAQQSGRDVPLTEDAIVAELPAAAPTETVESELMEEPKTLAQRSPKRPVLRGTLSDGQ
ncbi:MAG: hypothetical protein AAF950_16655 [Pseudomonadota bacterium]